MIQIPIEVGDVIYTGKFRNKRTVVKDIGTDEHGLPTVNGHTIMKIRIEKLEKERQKTEGKVKLKDFLK